MSLGGELQGLLGAQGSASVVVLTHNRRHLLQQCVENVLQRASARTAEILIWNNASADGTAEYLDGVDDPRITVVHHPTNIGVNAYARVFPRMSGTYLIEVDDDVIDAPSDWDARLVESFEKLPGIGYLAANLVDNPNDVTSRVMYGTNAARYRVEEIEGVRVKVGGPVGGWCSVTSRELHDRAGGWIERKGAFWQEEGVYLERLGELGFGCAMLEDLRVLHASGPYYSATPPEKLDYWRAYNLAAARKDAVKQVLLAVPGVGRLNDRYGWFHPPSERPDYVRLYGEAPPIDAAREGVS